MAEQIKKILIAVDSFKGSLSSLEVADSVCKGVLSVNPHINAQKFYIADGGEGTVTALVESLGGIYQETIVNDPLMRPIQARYGLIDAGATAVIEMASASGLTLLSPDEYNPMQTTTYGVGELVLDAMNQGCRKFLIAIGGSATSDGGVGMLQALGFRFFDLFGKELSQGGKVLHRIASIDFDNVDKRLEESVFEVACDVTNPLYGVNGAAYVYARQKGADSDMIEKLDQGLENYAKIVERRLGVDIQTIAGAGAAGGLGGGLAIFLGALLRSGIEIVLDALCFDEQLKVADLVITGEGKLDRQTLMGKAPKGVLDYAMRRGVPVIAICGVVEDAEFLIQQGFTAIYPIAKRPISLEWAMNPANAKANIETTISQIITERYLS